MKSKTSVKSTLLFLLGIVLCVVPVLSAIASYFPVWCRAGDGSAVSGGVLILLVLAAVPVFKLVKRYLASPSAYVLWLVLFLIFFMLSRIADEMTVISFVGFIGNLLGAVAFKLARRYGKEKSEETNE